MRQHWLSSIRTLMKRWAWALLLGGVVCGSATYLICKVFIRPVYQAQALVLVNGISSPSEQNSVTATIMMMPTLIQMVSSSQVRARVQAQQPNLTPQQIAQMVSAKQVLQQTKSTMMLEIDVKSTNATTAYQLAGAVSSSLATVINSQMGGMWHLTVTSVTKPTSPYSPRPRLDAALGAAAGLGLTLTLTVIFEWIDDRLAFPEEVNELLDLDLLTVIPTVPRRLRRKPIEEARLLAESCRVLGASVHAAQAEHPFKLLMVTSALPEEGKSTIAANIASVLAQSGKRVLLVDADLRHPVLDQHFHLENSQGWSNAFLCPWEQVEGGLNGQDTAIPSLRVLTTGAVPSNPPELLQSSLAQRVFTHLSASQQFDYIIFDTPPVLPVVDASLLASYAQMIILVADASRTPRRALARAKQVLSRTGTRCLGVALNKSPWPDVANRGD